ncbi:hypothetical protein KKD84_05230 [Patescibacteria group bacterium]|nr:hypothetical protein [Patescibacteria group bacterium]
MKKTKFFEGFFKKGCSRGGGGKKTRRNAGEIEEYDFFVAKDQGEKGAVAPRDKSADRNSDKNAPDKGMTFFLWE